MEWPAGGGKGAWALAGLGISGWRGSLQSVPVLGPNRHAGLVALPGPDSATHPANTPSVSEPNISSDEHTNPASPRQDILTFAALSEGRSSP